MMLFVSGIFGPIYIILINIFFLKLYDYPIITLCGYLAIALAITCPSLAIILGHTNVSILTQNHLIDMNAGYIDPCINCYSLNDITKVTTYQTYFHSAPMSIYSKEKLISRVYVYSEHELNTIFKHLDIVQEEPDIFHYQSKTKNQRLLLGVVYIPTIIIIIIYYIGIGTEIYPSDVKIALALVPVLWMVIGFVGSFVSDVFKALVNQKQFKRNLNETISDNKEEN